MLSRYKKILDKKVYILYNERKGGRMRRPQNLNDTQLLSWIMNNELQHEPDDFEKDCWIAADRKCIGKDNRPHYYYKGKMGLVAHECILDTRNLIAEVGLTIDDIAKRLIDYGFHAPTMSWPVANTLMIEPTESESKAEIDRFCESMCSIKGEIDKIKSGEFSSVDNPKQI